MIPQQSNLTPEQERNVERLLATANLFKMRGQLIDAEDKCREILAITPNNIVAREILCEVLYECGKIDQALAEIRAAKEIAPDNPMVEKKFAKLTLAVAERDREKAIAQDMIENPHEYAHHKSNPGKALLIAAFIPGLGQFYNGDFTKAYVIWGMLLIHILSWVIFQDTYPKWAVTSIAGFIQFTNPLVLITGLIFSLAYLYGMIDAAVTATKIAETKVEKKPDPLENLMNP